ncbi:MAG: FtsX-like permease family protein [Nitrospiraceae bacterium]|nr:FtsX-like permease family protein [Nitrospiraceae bacterium]
MTLLQLLKLIVLKNIRADRFLTVLSIVGVALGIGLFSGVKVASDRAVSSFDADISGINPRTNYEILDTSGLDFREEIYRKVREKNDASFPLLEIKGYLPAFRETIDIRGLDTVRVSGYLDMPTGAGSGYADYFRTVNGILITKRFAHEHRLKKGDLLKALVYDRAFDLKVVDLLDMPPLPQNTFIMDIGNFQEYLGRVGWLSGIDLIADEAKAAEIRQALPRSLAIGRKERAIEDQKALIKSFRYNLEFISLIAILVGVFLLYNTVFISVVKRRTEIGILRGLGIGKRTVVALFLLHGLFLGLIGSALGIVFGQAFAYVAAGAVEKTISTMYGAISIRDFAMTRGDILLSFVVGILVSLVASAVPAFEAAGTRPVESAREGTFEAGRRERLSHHPLFGMAVVISGGILAYIEYRYMPFDFPFLAYAGILAIILGFTVLSPVYLSLLLRAFGRISGRLFGSTGIITAGDMQGSIYRFSVALMSVAISSALIISLFTLIFSFRNSLKGWIGRNITADVYIKPLSCTSNFCYFPLSEDLVKEVGSAPGVAFVDRFRTLMIDFKGRKIVAGFGERAALQERLHRPGTGRYPGDGRSIGVSTYLATRYGLRKGETVHLDTPAGRKAFVIGDVFSSYSTSSGFVYLDRRWLKEYWGLDDTTQLGIYLDKGVDAEAFIRRLEGTLQPRYSVGVMNARQLKDGVLAIFDRTFAITYAIELISILVSLIGVVNTLLALVLERKREISILRYLGADWTQLRAMLLLSAGITGIAGIALGAVIGPAMSVIFIEVINKISFGWEIHIRLPLLHLLLTSLGLFLAILLAGMIPMGVARKIDPKRFVSFE